MLKVCTGCLESLPATEFHRRAASSDGRVSKCKFCVLAYRIDKGREHFQKVKKAWHLKNAAAQQQKALKAYRLNRDFRKDQHRKYMQATSEQQKAYRRRTAADCLHRCKKYRAAILKRFPGWVTDEELRKIRELYGEANRLAALTGVKFHIDHILPIQGEKVCGLHVLLNLQILTASENISKGNRYEP